jgi:hypothetical protein
VARQPRGVGPVTVSVPIDAVLAVRSSAQMSRDGISDDYEGYRHKGRDYEDMARRRAGEMAELDELLGQLGDDEEQGREITGDYDTLHGVLGDVLMDAIRELAVTAGTYWRHEGSLGDVDRQIAYVQARVLLLREAERAADERRAADDEPDG